ncbi:MAG: ATP-binding protein [Acidobacteriota bacterium]|nr:ATP-binding protein [Acidobacteriota bacterium]
MTLAGEIVRLKIVYKLFLAMLATSGAVLVLLAVLLQINLDRGFLEYLNQLDLEQHEELIRILKSRYSFWGGWEPLQGNHREWEQILALSRGENLDDWKQRRQRRDGPPRRRGPGRRGPGGGYGDGRGGDRFDGPPPRRSPGETGRDEERPRRRPPRGDNPPPDNRYYGPPADRDPYERNDPPPVPREDTQETLDQDGEHDTRGRGGRRPPPPRRDHLRGRLTLYDADMEPVIARGPPDDDVTLKPIELNGKTIGHLAVAPLREVQEGRGLNFLNRQSRFFYATTGLMFVLAALVSILLARHLSRRASGLAAAARKLSNGDYKARVKIGGGDEIGDLAQDFNQMAHALQEGEDARRRWTADISHELRTPLAVLRGEVEALRDGVRRVDEETLESLHTEVLGLSKLVDDLYQLSLSDMGALNYKKELIDPLEILERTLGIFKGRLAQHELELVYEPDDSFEVEMQADQGRLQQLFTNILENSCRYTDPEGRLEVKAVLSEENMLTISLADTEPGVEPAQCAKLFERHFRTRESGRREKRGAGLGLAICKNIVEAHEGHIEARPASIGGVEMRVTFPVQRIKV